MSHHHAIAKSASIIGMATFCSRLLGFCRDVVIARLFGVYVYAQAFVIAFKIPNLFRDLLAEGAANSAFVPVFSEYNIKHTKKEFWGLANVVLNILLLLLTALTLIGIVFTPLIVRVIAPGFIADPFKLETTIRLTRIIFPYLLLISLAAYAMAILNSLKHFVVPAFAPCLLNISIIVFALFFGEGIKGIALGILVGGALQLLIQIPVLYRKGFRLQLFKNFYHPAAKRIGKLLIPRIASTSIYQLNNFIDSIFASLAFIVGEGGVAVMYFAYRLVQFPVGIFSNALSQAILPTFSTQALEDNYSNLKRTFSWGLRTVFFIMLPVSVVFMVLSRQIIQSLFQGGRFDIYATTQTADVLFYYSIGLFAYGANKISQCCFFALKDTATPANISLVTLVVNIILNIMLMFPLKVAGLALATSISGIISFIILILMLRAKIGRFGGWRILFSIMRILAASILMGIILFIVSRNVSLSVPLIEKVFLLTVFSSVGIISYVIFCAIFGVVEMKELWNWMVVKRR